MRNRTNSVLFSTIAVLLLIASDAAAQHPDTAVRVGIIGLDTGHGPAFAKILNAPDAAPDVAGFRVVAAYPYGSRTIEGSHDRIILNTAEVQKLGVEIVGSIEDLLRQVDMVLLETNDGRPHLEQALQVFRAGKPVFIDKPISASLSDAIAIFDAARHYNVPVFSSSALRYVSAAQAIRGGSIGQVQGADTYSPAVVEKTHPDLFWYGVHGVEMLFTVMGTGCEEVVRMHTDSTDVVVCRWSNGRLGTFRGIRMGQRGFGGTAFGADKIASIGPYIGYRPLVVAIAEFFRTGVGPVSPEETLEIFAFMEAADESKRRGGAPVRIDGVLARARALAQARWTAQ